MLTDSTTVSLALFTLVFIALFFWFLRWFLQVWPDMKKTEESHATLESAEKELEGLGGWLILVCIGLFVTVLIVLITFVRDIFPIFTEGYWSVLTMPDSEAYHPYWKPVILFEIISNLLIVMLVGYAICLFFKKSLLFPRIYIIFIVVVLIVQIIDYFGSNLVSTVAMQNDADLKGLARAFSQASIWIPYMLRSKRVKNTFVK